MASRLLLIPMKGTTKMSQDESIKIRTLPRKNEKAKDEAQKPNLAPKPVTPRWIIYVGTSSCVLLAGVLFFDKPQTPAALQVQQTEMASVAQRQNAAVSRHLQESHMHRQLLVQRQMLENSKIKTQDLKADEFALDPARSYGVQLDLEANTDRVFEDLNVNSKNFAESTPDEKINARLANRRWVNELERRERVTFIRNFIKSAYDRGYEVEINENLVVVGVKKITDPKKMNIDQILNKMSKAY
jgi:hypothetical protein